MEIKLERKAFKDLIAKIEEKRKSKVIALFLGDRGTLETKIHSEVLPYFFMMLKDKKDKIQPVDLFLYSTGGITTAGWGIANLLNEFAEYYSVLIPFKAYSTATLIAMGAKEIYMTEVGQLSPIDPSVNSPYNPIAPGFQFMPGVPPPGPIPLLPVPVEDCISYFNFARQGAGIKKNEDITKVFQLLVEKIHPLALGGVYRANEQIKMLSKKLLEKHVKDPTKVEQIINILTKELYSHDYIISRREAKDILGLPVIYNEEIEGLVWQLFLLYSEQSELMKPFIPEVEFASLTGSGTDIKTYYRGFIESGEKCYSFISERRLNEITITRPGIGPEKAIRMNNIFEGWRELK